MVVTVAPQATGVLLRPYTPADAGAVVMLANADRLPGQPDVTPAMLQDALEGRSPVDAAWWAELDAPAAYVAVDGHDRVTGVISYALRPKDDTGLILWLHCRENRTVADALIGHALHALGSGSRPVHACDFASALTRGLEGLPVRHRPVTDAALRSAGFTATDLWSYQRLVLPAHRPPGLGQCAMERTGPEEYRLTHTEGKAVLAEATIGAPAQGVGVLWWIGVTESARGRGLGRSMLGTALNALANLGATEVILFVDDDAPDGDARDRNAAKSLYRSAGFVEIDRLNSYRH